MTAGGLNSASDVGGLSGESRVIIETFRENGLALMMLASAKGIPDAGVSAWLIYTHNVTGETTELGPMRARTFDAAIRALLDQLVMIRAAGELERYGLK